MKSEKKSLQELHLIFKKDVTVNSIKCILRLRGLRNHFVKDSYIVPLTCAGASSTDSTRKRQKTPKFALAKAGDTWV